MMRGTTLTSIAKVNSLIRRAVVMAVAITGATVPVTVLVIEEWTSPENKGLTELNQVLNTAKH